MKPTPVGSGQTKVKMKHKPKTDKSKEKSTRTAQDAIHKNENWTPGGLKNFGKVKKFRWRLRESCVVLIANNPTCLAQWQSVWKGTRLC